jgi:hypothetical protein
MTQVNSAATSNGDFIYVFKGTGTTTGAYTMKPSQQLIGAGATLNVPTVGPLVTIAGAAGNTPTLGGTVTLASSVTVAGIDMSTGASSAVAGASITGVSVTARDVTTTTGVAINIGGSGNTGPYSFRSVSSSGAVNGISLANMTGGFTITGNSGAGTGGTILNSTGDGIVMTSVDSPGLISASTFSGVRGVGVQGTGRNLTQPELRSSRSPRPAYR